MNECWNCGQPGIPWPPGLSAVRRICLDCDVIWSAQPMIPGQVRDEMLWMGKAVPVVDFTRPGALSCPA